MSDDKASIEKKERESSEVHKEVKHFDTVGSNVNAKLANPLAGIPADQLMDDAANFAEERGLGHLKDVFRKGALVAQDPMNFESIDILSEEDKHILRREVTNRWAQPWELYYLVILCSLAAAVQGVSSFYKVFDAPQLLMMNFLCRWMSRSLMVHNCSSPITLVFLRPDPMLVATNG